MSETTLPIVNEAHLHITGPCGRRVMTTLAQEDLTKAGRISRIVTQHAQGHVGLYAEVVQGGTIRRGDRIKKCDGKADSSENRICR